MDRATITRFWAKVDRRGPSECWPWIGARDGDGYGQTGDRGRCLKAHRVAFFLAYGKWPVPLGRHSCDNPPCCNPAHVIAGTHRDNMDDMGRRGRRRIGERHGRARLSEDDVRDILARRDGETQKAIAAAYRVSRATIWYILQRRTWAHVSP